MRLRGICFETMGDILFKTTGEMLFVMALFSVSSNVCVRQLILCILQHTSWNGYQEGRTFDLDLGAAFQSSLTLLVVRRDYLVRAIPIHCK